MLRTALVLVAGLFTPPATVFVVETAGVNGLSGLAPSGPGRALAVAERERALIEFTLPGPDGPPRRLGAPLRLEGVGADEETEDLAALSEPDQFVLVTERQAAGAAEEFFLFAERRADALVVTRRVAVDLRATWGLEAAANAGLEGVCAVGDHVIAALETVVPTDGGRAAPLVVLNRRTGALVGSRVRLTSETGKLSALTCRVATAGAVEVVAIERHYGVGRLVGFTLDPVRPAPMLSARVLRDFSSALDPLPNPEGLMRLAAPPDRFLILTDNDSGRGIDVTRMIVLDAPP
jgi:hypothetical protein